VCGRVVNSASMRDQVGEFTIELLLPVNSNQVGTIALAYKQTNTQEYRAMFTST